MSEQNLFIKLSSLQDEPIYLNVTHISYMREGRNSSTFITLQNSSIIEVIESTDYIFKLMKFL